jgi:hypothetical protein
MPDLNQVAIPDGPWPYGVDSVTDPLFVNQGNVCWATNSLNKGGIYQTRPGYSILYDSSNTDEPRGLSLFSPKNKGTVLVKAIGTAVRTASDPFNTWSTIPGITLSPSASPVYMTNCYKGAQTQADGSLEFLDTFPMMIIQDGESRAYSWDGSMAHKLNPDPSDQVLGAQTPIGKFGTWVGNRYWVAVGARLYASNELEPDKFTETLQLASGGYFTLPGVITGMGTTADAQSLIVFTATTTSVFEVNVPREQWSATPGFQTVLLQNIGCIAHRSIVNQYGMLWWMSEGGLINLNEALAAFRSSRIRFKDHNMNRSKSNLSRDKSGICSGTFENFMTVSVPSGDLYNAHTWLMDEMPSESDETTLVPAWASTWTGIKPIQWVTGTIDGHSRVFVLSRDEMNNGGFTSNVWEAFNPTRQDYGVDSSGNPTIVSIPVQVETRYLSDNTQFKIFLYIAALYSELNGTALHSWSYASRHSGYLEVLDKTTSATTTSVDHRISDLGQLSIPYVQQTRELRSTANVAAIGDRDVGVESNYTRNKDRGFQLLFNWEGRAALNTLLLICQPMGDTPTGRLELDETVDKVVNADGDSYILETAPIQSTVTAESRLSARVNSVSARLQEQTYGILR